MLTTVFGVIHGDLYYHDIIEGKTLNPFTYMGRVAASDVSGTCGIITGDV